MRKIVIIAHDLRSAHNVGALLRTAEGLGVSKIYLTGHSPYPKAEKDTRIAHLAQKQHNQIAKTALGAEQYLNWSYETDPIAVIAKLRSYGYLIVGLEQSKNAKRLDNFQAPAKICLLLGREVEGIDPILINLCDEVVFIKMHGLKESFNVVEAASMALFYLRLADNT